MDDERGSLWDALKRALKSNPEREKAYNYAPGPIANRTVAQAESDITHAIDACYDAGNNLKRLEEAMGRLEDVLKNIDEASSLARRKSDVSTLRALEAAYNKGELELNRYDEKLSRIEMNAGSKWSSLHAKEASEKAGPGAKAAEAFALMATEAEAQAKFIDRGETEIFIRKGPIERAINAIGTGKAQDDARALLRNMVGMAQGPINPTEGKRGISMKLVAASLRSIAEHASEQARMHASMTVPGSKEAAMSETTKGDSFSQPLYDADTALRECEAGLSRCLNGDIAGGGPVAIRAANKVASSIRRAMGDGHKEAGEKALPYGRSAPSTAQSLLDSAMRDLGDLFSDHPPFLVKTPAERLGRALSMNNPSSSTLRPLVDALERGYSNAVDTENISNRSSNYCETIIRACRAYMAAKDRGEKGTDDDGEQWDEQGWGVPVEFDEDGNPKPARKKNVANPQMATQMAEHISAVSRDAVTWANQVEALSKWADGNIDRGDGEGWNRVKTQISNAMQSAYEMRDVIRLAAQNAGGLGDKKGRKEADEDGDTLEGIMKAARSEKAGFPFKKKKPAADPNAEGDPNAQQQPQQGQPPAQQALGKAPPFGKKKVPTPGQQPGMPMAEQNPQDGDQQDAEDPADIQTDAQGNQLGTNGEFAGQTVGSMTADQFGTALAAAMQPVIQAIAALNAATVQRTKEATDAAEARIANLEGEQPVLTRLERGYRASQKGPAPADAATYPMPNSAPSTEETFLNWALNGSNGARP